MQRFLMSASILTAIVFHLNQPASAQYEPDRSGPNDSQERWNSYGRAGFPASTPRYGDAAGCRCTTCDPRVPCSPQTCRQQDCRDCGSSCPNCPSRSKPQNGLPQPPLSERTARWGGQKMCPVTGEELGSMGPVIPVAAGGRTIYVCCEACVNAVRRDPQKYIQRVNRELGTSRPGSIPSERTGRGSLADDRAFPRAQRLCPVTGEELGSMGRPIPVTVLGRTIYVCCEACVAPVRRDPEKYLRRVENERSITSEP